MKTKSTKKDTFACNFTTNDDTGQNRNNMEKSKYCVMCQVETHWSSDCENFNTIANRITKLKELKRCSYCTKRGHKFKEDCGKLTCGHCQKIGHNATLCMSKLLSLACNKNKDRNEIINFDKTKKAQTTTTTVENVTTNLSTSDQHLSLPTAVAQI